MDTTTYSHLVKQESWNDEKIAPITKIIGNLKIRVRAGCSAQLREAILKEINAKGWSSKVKLSHSSQISITAINGEQALCLQTGNMSRFYADLLKLQYLYQRGNIKSAVYILPTKRAARIMGSNLAHFERLVDELKLFEQVITIPIFVIGIN
jgi:hypothetical protein